MITDLYSRLKKLRVVIRLVDGRIDLQAPKGVLNKELLQEIKDNKEALIVLLDTYKKRTTNYLSIEKVPEQEDYKLSSSQYRLWLLSQFEGGNVAYNMPGVYEITGSLDPVLLEMAFNAIISRHEILRTVFREDGNGEVRQVVLGAADQALRISITDLGDGSLAEVVSLLGASVSGEFDLGSGPLLRADLYRLGNDHWLLSFVMHHIISDGWSLGVLMRELSIFYNAGVRGEVASVAALPLQYKDYSVWEQSQLSGELLTAHRSYWLAQFSGDLPVLELPADRLRPEVKSYRGGSVYHQLDQRLSEELKAQSHSGGGTLFMGLIAGVTGLLYRYSHQQDIVIGSPIAGRHHASLEDQIGLYLNTLALRMRFGDADSFRSLLDRSREVALGAYEHQVYPFDELINELSLAGNGLFNVMVVLQNNALITRAEEAVLDGLEIQNYRGLENKVSKFDLLFEFVETSVGIHLGIAYNSDIYDEVRISRMAVHLEQFLLSALASPEVSLGELNYLSAAEEHELLETFNPKAAAYVSGTVLDLLKARHDVDPDAIALVYEDRRVSYRWLDEQSTLLSVYLREECQLVTSDLVGVQLPRTEWLIVCLLGVLKSGCAYVPVDPGYPQQRIDYLLADSGCKEVLDESFLAVFQQAISAVVSAEEFSAAGLKTAVYAAELSTNSLAYLIYTSGSTGLPKGVMVSHGNMYSFLKWSEKEFRASDFEVLFGVTSVCFDLSVYEIFYPLISGKLLRLLPDALSISSYLSGCSKVLLNTVPSVVGGLLREGVDLRGVSVLNMAGEPIPGAYLEQLDLSVMEVRNLYGPSEDTTYSTCYRFDAPFPVLIGKPIDHTQVYILDAGSSLVPVGVSGEICLGGLGVSLGYLNRVELTGEKFVANPFKPGERMYRTGDLGRWDSSGFIEYQGRLDEQVKIRGYRVELGEIESRLVSLEGISSAVVLARSSGGGGFGEGEQELVAYLAGEQEILVSVIREQLGRSMPNYLVPNYYVQVDAIPLTSNGKVDKKKLLALAVSGLSSGMSYIAPRNPTEHDLAVIWSELLGRAEIGVKDNFFDLGGHSLKAMRLQNILNKRYGFGLKIQDIYNYPTIEALALNKEKNTSFLNLNKGVAGIKRSIYFIPPILGSSIIYRTLAESLEGEFNCYGLQYPGLEKGEVLFSSIEQAARDFSEKIIGHSTTEELTIVGYSMGAAIAFEIAKILEAQGKLLRLILVDRNPRQTSNSFFDFGYKKRAIDYLFEQFKQIVQAVNLEEKDLKKFLTNNIGILDRYEYQGVIKSPIHVVEALGNEVRTNMKDWEKHTEGNFNISFINEGHWQLFSEDTISQFLKIVQLN
ncbi:amino acid adenylation domain-containing protein [Pedobacter sp. PAMC26386]|nr:amino acid adenylation domain-containing protein [Pedobacter sp. PAMC26386]